MASGDIDLSRNSSQNKLLAMPLLALVQEISSISFKFRSDKCLILTRESSLKRSSELKLELARTLYNRPQGLLTLIYHFLFQHHAIFVLLALTLICPVKTRNVQE